MEELCRTNEPPHKHPRGCHYNLSPPPCFSSPVVFHTFCLYTSSLSLRASAVAVPSAVKLHAQAERRRPTLPPPRLYETRPAVSLCLPSSLCRCCLAPAADGHEARLFQLTLGCINNGLLYALSSTDMFVLHAEGKRRLQFLSFIHADRSLRSPNPAKSCWNPLNFQLSQTCIFK